MQVIELEQSDAYKEAPEVAKRFWGSGIRPIHATGVRAGDDVAHVDLILFGRVPADDYLTSVVTEVWRRDDDGQLLIKMEGGSSINAGPNSEVWVRRADRE